MASISFYWISVTEEAQTWRNHRIWGIHSWAGAENFLSTIDIFVVFNSICLYKMLSQDEYLSIMKLLKYIQIKNDTIRNRKSYVIFSYLLFLGQNIKFVSSFSSWCCQQVNLVIVFDVTELWMNIRFCNKVRDWSKGAY